MSEEYDYGWVETKIQHDKLLSAHKRHNLEINALDDGLSYWCHDHGVKWKVTNSVREEPSAPAGNSGISVEETPAPLIQVPVGGGLFVYLTPEQWALVEPHLGNAGVSEEEHAGHEISGLTVFPSALTDAQVKILYLEQRLKSETKKRSGMQKMLDQVTASLTRAWKRIALLDARTEDMSSLAHRQNDFIKSEADRNSATRRELHEFMDSADARLKVLEEMLLKSEVVSIGIVDETGGLEPQLAEPWSDEFFDQCERFSGTKIFPWQRIVIRRAVLPAGKSGKIDPTGYTEIKDVRDEWCPRSQIGKPPHCGFQGCPFLHGENHPQFKDKAEESKKRFFIRKANNGVFVYDSKLRHGEQAIAAIWNECPSIDAERWLSDMVAVLNRDPRL